MFLKNSKISSYTIGPIQCRLAFIQAYSIRSLIGFLQQNYTSSIANVSSINCRTLVTSITTIIDDINQSHRDIPLFRCQNPGRLLKTSRKVQSQKNTFIIRKLSIYPGKCLGIRKKVLMTSLSHSHENFDDFIFSHYQYHRNFTSLVTRTNNCVVIFRKIVSHSYKNFDDSFSYSHINSYDLFQLVIYKKFVAKLVDYVPFTLIFVKFKKNYDSQKFRDIAQS